VQNRDLVVIGASAGGIEALQHICTALPADLNAAVLIVLHTAPTSFGLLPRILRRAGCVSAESPIDGELIEKGNIYVAPPDHHMIVEGRRIRLVRGPRENRHRPAVDPMFRSAALAYGNRVIGVILSGALDDGTGGLMVVRAHGGAAIVQDPSSAAFPYMPESALKMVKDAHVVPLSEIANVIMKLVSEPVEIRGRLEEPDPLAIRDVKMSELDMSEVENDIRAGQPSVFGCPECGGVLWEIDQKGFLRFRCRVGHAYTATDLSAEQRQVIETALWAALRALEESASLYRRLANRASGLTSVSSRWEERATTAEMNAHTLRNFLVNVNTSGPRVDEMAEPAQAKAS
jgi:two-component system chemotaxis response regulator CheB